jgi:hypothetical protein
MTKAERRQPHPITRPPLRQPRPTEHSRCPISTLVRMDWSQPRQGMLPTRLCR